MMWLWSSVKGVTITCTVHRIQSYIAIKNRLYWHCVNSSKHFIRFHIQTVLN